MPRNLKKKKHQFLTQERNSILQCNMISFVVSIIFTILIILYVYYSFYFDTTRVILIHRSNSLVFKSYIISQLLFSHESISLTRIMEIHMEKKTKYIGQTSIQIHRLLQTNTDYLQIRASVTTNA